VIVTPPTTGPADEVEAVRRTPVSPRLSVESVQLTRLPVAPERVEQACRSLRRAPSTDGVHLLLAGLIDVAPHQAPTYGRKLADTLAIVTGWPVPAEVTMTNARVRELARRWVAERDHLVVDRDRMPDAQLAGVVDALLRELDPSPSEEALTDPEALAAALDRLPSAPVGWDAVEVHPRMLPLLLARARTPARWSAAWLLAALVQRGLVEDRALGYSSVATILRVSLGETRDLALLQSLTSSRRPEERLPALIAFGRVAPTAKAALVLALALRDPDPRVRHAAALGARRCGAPLLHEPLAALLTNELDGPAGLAAARALGAQPVSRELAETFARALQAAIQPTGVRSPAAAARRRALLVALIDGLQRAGGLAATEPSPYGSTWEAQAAYAAKVLARFGGPGGVATPTPESPPPTPVTPAPPRRRGPTW
jgi:hypothetical protein